MPNYQNGKVYKIISDETDKAYVGSSCLKYLSSRLANHKAKYKEYQNGKGKYCTSFDIVKFDNCEIVLLENCKCDTIEELHQREKYWIDQLGNCVNKCIPTQTYAEYAEKNKEKLQENHKKYYQQNKEKIKEYHQQNKDKSNAYQRKYYLTHKEKLKEKVNCDACNCEVSKQNYSHHIKTQKHIQNIAD